MRGGRVCQAAAPSCHGESEHAAVGQVDDAAAALLTPPMMAWARLNVEQQRPAQAPRLTYFDVASPIRRASVFHYPPTVKGVEGNRSEEGPRGPRQ